MISIFYSQNKRVLYGDGLSCCEMSVMCKGEDVPELPMKDVHPGALAYITDWHELDSDSRERIGAQVLAFDGGSQWVPQKVVYGT